MSRNTHPFFTFVITLLAACGTVGVVLFLLFRMVVFTGLLTTASDLSRPAPFISEPKPSDRLKEYIQAEHEVTHQLIGSPVYVDLTPPSDFSAIDMIVHYTNAGQRVVELGALSSSLDEQFVLKAVENSLLDGLSWPRVASGELTVLQRTHNYTSLDEFFRRPPDRSRIATFHASADGLPFHIPNYAPLDKDRTVAISLRGSHRMLTYVKDEPLSFSFSVQDMNRQEGADPVFVSVYRDGVDTPMTRVILQDDGNTRDDQRSSSLRTIAVFVPNPEPGLYKIEFTTTADVFIRTLTTRQKKLVFEDHVYAGDHVGYSAEEIPPLVIWTDGKQVSARTAHPESLQTIVVDKKSVQVNQVNTDFVTLTDGGFFPVTLPKRDLLLLGDRVFAFSADEWFDPLPYPIEWFTSKEDLDRAGIDYILMAYEPPAVHGATKTAIAVFDQKKLARTKDGAFRFVIAAPGIADTHEDLQIKDVTFTMRRSSISLQNFWQEVSALFTKRAEPVVQVISNGTSYGESLP